MKIDFSGRRAGRVRSFTAACGLGVVLCATLILCLPAPAMAQAQPGWAPIPPADLSKLKPSDFADHEFDVPYHLEHFHTVFNRVVETGEHRGFLDIPVNRNPPDNKPYNARILENHAWLSFFYTEDRPWNPYRGMPQVRQRLEAMLDFWCRSQSPEGYFSEYKPQDWNLAATGFGVLWMSHTLDALSAPNAPQFDRELLERTFAAQRKSLMAICTDDRMLKIGRYYSNQFSGAYRAGLAYLRLRPDPELEKALIGLAEWASKNSESPAGFLYEQGAPDFGYSRVHDNNMLNAEVLLLADGAPARLREVLLNEYRRWNTWLGYNFAAEPDGSGYFINAAPQLRTSHWFQGFHRRPFMRQVQENWPFGLTDEESKADFARRRAALAADWPTQRPLGQYAPRHGFAASHADAARVGLEPWYPAKAQRDAAVAALPYLASDSFTQLRMDPRPLGLLYVRRPGYYATFNFGRKDQSHGLGLVWHPKFGTVLQTLPGEAFAFGTRLGDAKSVHERSDLKPTIAPDGISPLPLDPPAGVTDLPASADLAVTYPLGGAGRKTVRFTGEGIIVEIDASGAWSEQIPLVLRRGAAVAADGTRGVTVRRPDGGPAFVIGAADGMKIEIGKPAPAGRGETPADRAIVTLSGTGPGRYTLRFVEP